MPHVGASVITAAPRKNLFLTTQVVLRYWTDSQEVEDLEPLYIPQTHHNITYTLNLVNMTIFAVPHSSAWQAQNSEVLGQNLCWKMKFELKVQSVAWSCQSLHVSHKKATDFKGNDYYRFDRQTISLLLSNEKWMVAIVKTTL